MKYSEMKKIPINQFKDCIKFPSDVRERWREREAGKEGETDRVRKKERRVAFALPPVYVMM